MIKSYYLFLNDFGIPMFQSSLRINILVQPWLILLIKGSRLVELIGVKDGGHYKLVSKPSFDPRTWGSLQVGIKFLSFENWCL